jgi:hypothetical protein
MLYRIGARLDNLDRKIRGNKRGNGLLPSLPNGGKEERRLMAVIMRFKKVIVSLIMILCYSFSIRTKNELPYKGSPCFSYKTTPSTEYINQCRPSFIIIGAGKSGTSSLYKYLLGHPKNLPCRVKQTHYFKYDHIGEGRREGKTITARA